MTPFSSRAIRYLDAQLVPEDFPLVGFSASDAARDEGGARPPGALAAATAVGSELGPRQPAVAFQQPAYQRDAFPVASFRPVPMAQVTLFPPDGTAGFRRPLAQFRPPVLRQS